jgi:DnaJ-class molecular chaperone
MMKTGIPFKNTKGDLINYYEILNVPHDATRSAIRSSFCSLIKMFHPDISGDESREHRRKTELLIQGYKILIDDTLRGEYDRELFALERFSPEGYIRLPKKRVKYSMSLSELLKIRLLSKKIRHRDRIYNLGQDVEVFVTPSEARRGVVAYIDLPSRIACPLCYGEKSECHICHGVGRISSTSMLQLIVSPPIVHGSVMDVDLLKARPDRFASFTMKTLRVKISIIGKR